MCYDLGSLGLYSDGATITEHNFALFWQDRLNVLLYEVTSQNGVYGELSANQRTAAELQAAYVNVRRDDTAEF